MKRMKCFNSEIGSSSWITFPQKKSKISKTENKPSQIFLKKWSLLELGFMGFMKCSKLYEKIKPWPLSCTEFRFENSFLPTFPVKLRFLSDPSSYCPNRYANFMFKNHVTIRQHVRLGCILLAALLKISKMAKADQYV